MTDRVYQFKISLEEISPKIWRRIQVPAKYTFWDLHVAIQDAMGWYDKHLHVFRIKRKHGQKIVHIGIPDDMKYEDTPEIHPGWEVSMWAHFNDLGVEAIYEYDFGDSWIHKVLLEGYLIKKKGIKYPRCIEGARACPPEDCGGIFGYSELLETLSNPKRSDYNALIEWLGGDFDSEHFDAEMVKFDSPKKRWRRAFSEPW